MDLSQYGVRGTGALWSTRTGIHKLTYDFRGDYNDVSLLFWNGEDIIELGTEAIRNGKIEVFVDAIAPEWGIIVLGETETADADFRIVEIEWIAESNTFDAVDGYLANLTGTLPTDSVGSVDIVGDQITLTTGSYARSITTLGNFAAGEEEFFRDLGTEGAGVRFDVENGIYSFDWSLTSGDTKGYDILYGWNGVELIQIGDRTSAFQVSSRRWSHDSTTAQINVVNGYLVFVALDQETKTGTSKFILDNFRPQTPTKPIIIDLQPNFSFGDVAVREDYTEVATGTGDRAISSISTELTGNSSTLSNYGTEGSIARWNVENGTYDEEDKLGTTELRITEIEQLPFDIDLLGVGSGDFL